MGCQNANSYSYLIDHLFDRFIVSTLSLLPIVELPDWHVYCNIKSSYYAFERCTAGLLEQDRWLDFNLVQACRSVNIS